MGSCRGDGCGNYYVLSMHSQYVTGTPVFFINTMADPNEPRYVVASGLWQFLRFYLRSQLHLLEYESSLALEYWPFNMGRVLEDDPALSDITDIPKPWELLK